MPQELNDLITRITPLAEETIRQVKLMGLLEMFFGLLMLCVTGTGFYIANKHKDDWQDAYGMDGQMVIFLSVSLIFLLISIILLPCGISHYIAPIPYLIGK